MLLILKQSEETHIMADFTALENEVSNLTSVVDSAIALINGFSDQLEAALTADNLADNSNVARLAAEFRAKADTLANAVAENTHAPVEG